jgi:hypothetical protein
VFLILLLILVVAKSTFDLRVLMSTKRALKVLKLLNLLIVVDLKVLMSTKKALKVLKLLDLLIIVDLRVLVFTKRALKTSKDCRD